MQRTLDAIVIGAGAAGLAAARALGMAGRDVLVVEARGRLGGRIHTHRDPAWPAPLELGAEFVHGAAPDTRAIARAAGLLVQELPERHAWARGGRWRPLSDSWARFLRVCARIDTEGADRSFDRFLAGARVPPDTRALARLMVEGYHAAPAEDVSAHSLAAAPEDAEEAANRQYRLPGGYDGVIAWLRDAAPRERVTVRLNTVVTDLHWSPGAVTVACRTPWNARAVHHRARCAIVTLPAGVLRAEPGAGGVLFSPALPAKRRALRGFAEARVHKVVLRFRDAFWEDARFAERRGDACAPAYFHDPTAAFPTWWTAAPSALPLLTGWAGGPAAARLDARTPEQRLADAVGIRRRRPRGLARVPGRTAGRLGASRLERRPVRARRLPLPPRRRRRSAPRSRPPGRRHALLRRRSDEPGRDRHGGGRPRERVAGRSRGAARGERTTETWHARCSRTKGTMKGTTRRDDGNDGA